MAEVESRGRGLMAPGENRTLPLSLALRAAPCFLAHFLPFYWVGYFPWGEGHTLGVFRGQSLLSVQEWLLPEL